MPSPTVWVSTRRIGFLSLVSPKRCAPAPSTTGKIFRRSSSSVTLATSGRAAIRPTQPPRVKPSSPAGSSMTPSSETFSLMTIFPISDLLSLPLSVQTPAAAITERPVTPRSLRAGRAAVSGAAVLLPRCLTVSPHHSGVAADKSRQLGGAMDSRRVKDDEPLPDRELVRYRRAATNAPDQPGWCGGYLYRVRKPDIARAIDRNRRQILERLR